MKRKGSADPTERIMKIINDLGLEEFTQVSLIGRMVKVELVYDPLDQERRNLQSFKSRLKGAYKSHNSIDKNLIQQIEYLLNSIDRISLNRVLVAVPSSDGIRRLEEQLTLLHREMKYRHREAREMKKLVRSLSSYVREYLRNMERTQ